MNLNDIKRIKTKRVVTPYITREAEDFMAIMMEGVDLPGMPKETHIRFMRLDKSAPSIEIYRRSMVDTIDGEIVKCAQTVWEVKGSKGSTYIVERKGDRLVCNCKGYIYRKVCKHIKSIQA